MAKKKFRSLYSEPVFPKAPFLIFSSVTRPFLVPLHSVGLKIQKRTKIQSNITSVNYSIIHLNPDFATIFWPDLWLLSLFWICISPKLLQKLILLKALKMHFSKAVKVVERQKILEMSHCELTWVILAWRCHNKQRRDLHMIGFPLLSLASPFFEDCLSFFLELTTDLNWSLPFGLLFKEEKQHHSWR